MFLFGSASLSLVLYLLLMLILKKFAARGSGCIIRPEPLNHGKQSPLSPPHFHFSLLSLTSNRRALKKKRREATEKEDGGRKEVQEETREVMWWEGKASNKMNEFLRREEERIYVFILFFFLKSSPTCIPSKLCSTKQCPCGSMKALRVALWMQTAVGFASQLERLNLHSAVKLSFWQIITLTPRN